MLGVDHDKIILLSTPFPTIPMLGKNCCCGVIVFYVGNKRCCIVLYCIVFKESEGGLKMLHVGLVIGLDRPPPENSTI